MTKEDIKSAILVLSREKECVLQAINNSMEGTGYVSPDGLIHADDYVNACSTALAVLNEEMGEDAE